MRSVRVDNYGVHTVEGPSALLWDFGEQPCQDRQAAAVDGASAAPSSSSSSSSGSDSDAEGDDEDGSLDDSLARLRRRRERKRLAVAFRAMNRQQRRRRARAEHQRRAKRLIAPSEEAGSSAAGGKHCWTSYRLITQESLPASGDEGSAAESGAEGQEQAGQAAELVAALFAKASVAEWSADAAVGAEALEDQ